MSERHRLALPAGYRLRRYRLEDVLGVGGFAITYLAVDEELNRRVAIKELLPTSFVTRANLTVVPHTASDEDQWKWAMERFMEEARALAALEHPNILRVYEIFRENGTAYAVTRYEEGGSLEACLRALGRPPSEAELRGILTPMLDALKVVHSHHFLHRDIKPANILLNRDDEPILIDFGSARTLIAPRSMPMTAIVTEGYAPFEQYGSDSTQGPWTDLYALGAVMYRAVTGTRPPACTERLVSSNQDPCQKLADAYRSIYSAVLLESIDWALRMDPKLRPQSASEWLETLTGMRSVPPPVPASRVAFEAQGLPPTPTRPRGEAKDSSPTLFSRLLGRCQSFLQKRPSTVAREQVMEWIDKAKNEETAAPTTGSDEVSPLHDPTRIIGSRPESASDPTPTRIVDLRPGSQPSTPPPLLDDEEFNPPTRIIGWDPTLQGPETVLRDEEFLSHASPAPLPPTDTNPNDVPSGATMLFFPSRPVDRAEEKEEVPEEPQPTRLARGEAAFQQATAAVRAGRVREAMDWYRQAAEAGNASAREQCARIEQRDEAEVTIEFLRRALGDTAYRRAREFARGIDVRQSLGRALDCYEEAAELGNEAAHCALGKLYEYGKGVRRSLPTAVAHYRSAGEGGHGEAMYHLGILYETGAGVPANLEQARAWLLKAIEHDYEPARDRLHLVELTAAMGGAAPPPEGIRRTVPPEYPNSTGPRQRPPQTHPPGPASAVSHDLFFSYCRIDTPRVDPILVGLEHAGFSMWWDRSGLDAGDDFEMVIGRKIASSGVFVIAVSRAAVDSEWVLRELKYARNRRKPIVPLYLDEVENDLKDFDFILNGIDGAILYDENKFANEMTRVAKSITRLKSRVGGAAGIR